MAAGLRQTGRALTVVRHTLVDLMDDPHLHTTLAEAQLTEPEPTVDPRPLMVVGLQVTVAEGPHRMAEAEQRHRMAVVVILADSVVAADTRLLAVVADTAAAVVGDTAVAGTAK